MKTTGNSTLLRNLTLSPWLTLGMALAMLLAACGQRGPLYLPESKQPAASAEAGQPAEEKSLDETGEDSEEDDETPTRT